MSRPWTLRRRLTIVVGLIILIVSTSIAAAVSLTTRRVLIERVDDDLVAFSTRPGPGPSPAVPAPGEEPFQPFALIRFSQNGDVVFEQPAGYADEPEPLPDVSNLTEADLGGSAGTFITLGTIDGSGSVRALVRASPDGYELLARSLDSVDFAARQTVLISLAVSLMAALAGITVAWFLLRRGFQPVDDMIDTAGAIAEGDLTKRADLVQSNTELGRLATALDHMLARIESADRDRLREAERLRRFADDASHELRTPIAAITGYAELYAEGGVEPGPKLDRAMERINEASHRAGRLIEDLLALARLDREIGSGRERMDVGALVKDIAEDMRISTGCDLRVDTDGSIMVDADPVWLRQAIENLITNAAAYGGGSTPIELEAHRTGAHAHIVVADHGPGIAESERELVFDRFARPDRSRDRTQGGAGLGLAIVREVVSSHQGDVAITETPGGGATVQISLPIADPAGLQRP